MIAALLLAATAPQSQTPQVFITQLYARYRDEEFSPFDHIDAIFAPRLAAAIRLDRRLHRGEEGALDHDPLCLCQDEDGLRAEIRAVLRPAPNRAILFLTLHSNVAPSTVSTRLTLLRASGGWRVGDIADQGSLLAYLDRANRKATKLRHGH